MEEDFSIRIDSSHNCIPQSEFYTSYNFNDPTTENRRRKDKFFCLRKIVKGLRAMKYESNNGFGRLDYGKQEDVLEERFRMVTEVLRTGSLYSKDFDKLRGEVRKRIVDIYQPNMKFTIPSRFQH